MEDEVDLRKYIDVLIRRWKVVAIITGVAVAVAALVSFLSPPVYSAEAAVLLTKTWSELVLEPKYRTTGVQASAASSAMREALADLVKTPSVAGKVIGLLGDKLQPGDRKIGKLLGKIRVTSKGDLIKISVRSRDRQQAADIANAWAEAYESHVNRLYSGIVQSPEELRAQAATAAREYQEKQKALEDFIRDNRIAELEQQIRDKEILCEVKMLREQVKSGSSAAASATANGLALFLLQTRAFTSLPEGIQFPPGSLAALNASLDDVDVLISTLESRPGGKPGQSLIELRRDILRLRAELEQEEARGRELRGARDIAWEAYTAVAGKFVEATVAVEAGNVVVKVADRATVPESPAEPRKAMNVVAIALVLGLIVGVLAAFGVEYSSSTRESPAATGTQS